MSDADVPRGRHRPQVPPFTDTPPTVSEVHMSRWQSEAISAFTQTVGDGLPGGPELLQALRNLDDDALIVAMSQGLRHVRLEERRPAIREAMRAELQLRVEEREQRRHTEALDASERLASAIRTAGDQADRLAHFAAGLTGAGVLLTFVQAWAALTTAHAAPMQIVGLTVGGAIIVVGTAVAALLARRRQST